MFTNQSEKKVSFVYTNSSGNTSVEYSNYVKLDKHDQVDFYVTGAITLTSANVNAVNQINFALYEASAATVAAPSAITSATAVMGMTTALQIRGAQAISLKFATFTTGAAATFSVGGVDFNLGEGGQSTSTSGAFTSVSTEGGGCTANATILSEAFATYFNSSHHDSTLSTAMREKWYCSTVAPTTAIVWILPKDAGATTLTATGTTLVAPGFRVVGHLGISANKLATNCQYVCVGVNSCTTKIPVSAIAVRSAGRYLPETSGLAVSKTLY